MKAYKFTVGSEFQPIASRPGWSISNCAAVVIARNREEAIVTLASNLAAHGDLPWHEVATVEEREIDGLPQVVIVVQL